MIRLEDVWKVYEKKGVEVNALQGISLELAEHEYISVTGASGSGKTTLLNIMGTIDAPTRGTVYFKDRSITDLNDASASRLRRKAIGFVFQTYNLLPDLTTW